MNIFFKDIFQYQHHFNQQLGEVLEQYNQSLTARTVPLFSHMLNAHQIWNARISGMEPFGVNDIHDLADCSSIDQDNFNKTMQILETQDLSIEVSYSNSKGQSFVNTIQEILFHVSNHHTHHRGQIISDLRMKGISPPVTDYIFYKR